MRTPRLIRRRAPAVAALLLAATVTGLGIGAATAAAAAGPCVSLTAAQPLNPDTGNVVSAVTVISPCNAWMAGSYLSGGVNRTLIEHWNGASWRVFPSASPGTVDNQLSGIHARSATDIWAVGFYSDAAFTSKTLVLHWNGHSWKTVPSPSPDMQNVLTAVHATAGADAWAVGHTFSGTHSSALLLHWNGHRWQTAKNPIPQTPAALLGVTATSARDAWAVGYSEKGASQPSLILHWNGRSWARVRSPDTGGSATINSLQGVAALSASNAWAVGYSGATAATERTEILHWNGRSWQLAPAPEPGGGSRLLGVAARSASDIWAVGFSSAGAETLAVHCC